MTAHRDGSPATGGDDTATVGPRVFISYAHDSDVHGELVRNLWIFLCANGVDARIDRVAAEQRQDWPLWMERQVALAERVLIIASPAYRERAGHDPDPEAGWGVQYEARLVRDLYYRNQTERGRFLPVVLPGCSSDDVPAFLTPATVTVYRIAEFTVPGAEKLLRIIFNRPGEVQPAIGPPPDLPTRDHTVLDFASVSTGPASAVAMPVDVTLPKKVRLRDVTEGTYTQAAIRQAWKDNAGGETLRAPIGLTADGEHLFIDLLEGPNLLVAGMTGSGKTELLRTLVLSLARSFSPAELAFVLIDFKGGAAFSECTNLPHALGVPPYTSLTEASELSHTLGSEIQRRQQCFLDARVDNFADHNTVRSEHRLRRIVVVVEEIATMRYEVPELFENIQKIARRSSYLGIHVVIATQRPGGVIDAEIRSVCRLKIALRLSDQADLYDIFGDVGNLSTLPPIPGRAYYKVGGSAIVQTQIALNTCLADEDEPTNGCQPKRDVDLMVDAINGAAKTNCQIR